LNIFHRKLVTEIYLLKKQSNNSVPYPYSTAVRLRDFRVPPRSRGDLRSSGLLLLRGGILKSSTAHLFREVALRHIQRFARLRIKKAKLLNSLFFFAGTKPLQPIASRQRNVHTHWLLLTHTFTTPCITSQKSADLFAIYGGCVNYTPCFTYSATQNKRGTAW